MKVKVIFYSMYSHVYRMAEAIGEGALIGKVGSVFTSTVGC
jgi:flavorubredoxin